MRQKRRLLFALSGLATAMMFLFSTSAMAQALSVRGKVIDKTGEAVIGASVLVEGTSNGTVTNLEGEIGRAHV